MIKVNIDGQEREGIDEGWVARQVHEARRRDEEPCVRVALRTSGIDMAVQTGPCEGRAGGGRPPNARERELLGVWDACGVSGSDYPVGKLIQCLKELERAL